MDAQDKQDLEYMRIQATEEIATSEIDKDLLWDCLNGEYEPIAAPFRAMVRGESRQKVQELVEAALAHVRRKCAPVIEERAAHQFALNHGYRPAA